VLSPALRYYVTLHVLDRWEWLFSMGLSARALSVGVRQRADEGSDVCSRGISLSGAVAG
jgi:hypothetical protein